MPSNSLLEISGDVDFRSVPGWKAAIASALLGDPDRLVLDLEKVAFIDSTGLGMLVATRVRCLDAGITFEVQHLPYNVRALLRLTGLDAVFDQSGAPGVVPDGGQS